MAIIRPCLVGLDSKGRTCFKVFFEGTTTYLPQILLHDELEEQEGCQVLS